MTIVQPSNGWGSVNPRAWQVECLHRLASHYGANSPKRGVVRAVMGSGKSVLLAQFLSGCFAGATETIVVTTSSIKLVEQLSTTIKKRLPPEMVGCYYTHGKDIHTPIVVTCLPSTGELAAHLQRQGKRCALWVADEAHRVETKTIHEAHAVLSPGMTLGMTATPFRSDPEQSLSLFDVLLYDYGPSRALKEKVVVPWRLVNWQGGEADLDGACMEMTELAIGPGMYNAVSIADADVFVQKLEAHLIPAAAIHSKLNRSEIASRLEQLRTGALKAIVHVAMLQEGVDLPWLRWLCMRRPVSSRVRFVQEIGRILRAYTDPDTGVIKEEAVLYDPHDLLGQMSLSHEAVLGGDYLEPEQDEAKEREKRLEQSVFEMMEALVAAKAGKAPLSLLPLAAYLRELVVAFDLCGLIERKIASRQWRTSPSTERQIEAMQHLSWTLGRKAVPQIHQKALGMVMELGQSLDRGMASDAISVLISLGDKKTWPDFKPLDRSASEGIQKEATRRAKFLPSTDQGQSLVCPPGVPGPDGQSEIEF